MKKIKIENKSKHTGNDFSKLNFDIYGKKCQIIVYNAIFVYDSSKCLFLTVLKGKINNLIFWVKIRLFAIIVIYG